MIRFIVPCFFKGVGCCYLVPALVEFSGASVATQPSRKFSVPAQRRSHPESRDLVSQ
jgi:hypothetical protein